MESCDGAFRPLNAYPFFYRRSLTLRLGGTRLWRVQRRRRILVGAGDIA
jgi:hypothetical protein